VKLKELMYKVNCAISDCHHELTSELL